MNFGAALKCDLVSKLRVRSAKEALTKYQVRAWSLFSSDATWSRYSISASSCAVPENNCRNLTRIDVMLCCASWRGPRRSTSCRPRTRRPRMKKIRTWSRRAQPRTTFRCETQHRRLVGAIVLRPRPMRMSRGNAYDFP